MHGLVLAAATCFLLLPLLSCEKSSTGRGVTWLVSKFVWSTSGETWALKQTQTKGDFFGCAFFKVNPHYFQFSVFLDGQGEPAAIWTMNPSRLVSANATLAFGTDGDLVLRDADKSLVWSAGTRATRLTLLETGNLVLFDEHETRLWESFEQQPAYLLLPEQALKFGQRLAADDRGMSFYLQVESHQVAFYDNRFISPQLYARWSSPGPDIHSIRFESNNHACALSMLDSRGNVMQRRSMGRKCVPYSFPRITLGVDGLLDGSNLCSSSLSKIFGDFKPVCSNYGIYEYEGDELCSCPRGRVGDQDVFFSNTDLGCVQQLDQNLSSVTGLLELPGVDHISNRFSAGYSKLGLDDCKQFCLKNSSCSGSFFKVANGSSVCYLSDVLLLLNVSKSHKVTAFIKVRVPGGAEDGAPAPARETEPAGPGERHHEQPLHNSKGTRRHSGTLKVTAITVIVGSFAALAISVFLLCHWRKRIQRMTQEEKTSEIFIPNLPRRFSHGELSQMTSHFRSRLGRGGFGTVYRGTYNLAEVAVKRLESAKQGQEQFETEVMTIGSLHPKNLVKLLGFSVDKPYYYLVYELMPNISLDKWLFENELGFLSWEMRLNICLGVAKGLSYLHHECSPPVLHLDIKPSNILLDVDFRAKICDFGLAKLVDGKQSYLDTCMQGTPGYMAPEWLLGDVTEKTDVFSFGIVLLEIVTGRRIGSAPTCMPVNNLLVVKEFEDVIAEKCSLSKVIDTRLSQDETSVPEQALRVLEVAMSCIQEDHTTRPSMSAVVKILESQF